MSSSDLILTYRLVSRFLRYRHPALCVEYFEATRDMALCCATPLLT